eukprot:395887-Rhodomonas_salina.1
MQSQIASQACCCGSAPAFWVWLVRTHVLGIVEGDPNRQIWLGHSLKEEFSEGCSTSNVVAHAPQGRCACPKCARRHGKTSGTPSFSGGGEVCAMVKRKTSSDPRQASRPIAPDDTQWPIEVGKLMKTPVFHPTEEEFSDFYAYAQKLDRLVGHVGVCKVIPPAGWKPRAHDVYTLKDSTEELEDAVTVKKPIRQNAIGGAGSTFNDFFP